MKRVLSVSIMVVAVLAAVPRAKAEDEKESPSR
jgi:hypothetical protein